MKKIRRLEMFPEVIGHSLNYYCRECHNHNFYEFMIIIKGKSIHHVNDEIQILEEGNLIFIRPADEHYFMPYTENTDKYEFYNIHASVEDIQKEYAECKKLKEVIDHEKLPPVVKLSTWELNFFQNKFKSLNQMHFGEQRDYLYYSLLKDVLNRMMDREKSEDFVLPEWMKRMFGNMDVRNPSSLKYENLLKNANVSKSYLWKSFKRYFDMTPTDYINNLKLEYAYELIVTTDKSILDISLASGFNNYSYFHRLFLKKYSITPNKIREQI